MSAVSRDAERDLLAAVVAFHRIAVKFEAQPPATDIAYIYLRGTNIAALSHMLASDDDPEQLEKSTVAQRRRASVLGRMIDDLLEDSENGDHSNPFASFGHLWGLREPEEVASAAALVLVQITELLTAR
jgi:hypothetical protein